MKIIINILALFALFCFTACDSIESAWDYLTENYEVSVEKVESTETEVDTEVVETEAEESETEGEVETE